MMRPIFGALCLSIAVPALAFPVQVPFPRFVDIASEVGVTLMNVSGDQRVDHIVDANGNGAGFFDYDNDGDVDLLIANGASLEAFRDGGSPMVALYENEGGQFVDVTREAGLIPVGWGMGVCVADYDNDGHRDFYLTAYGPNVLFRNNGDGTFQEADAGVADASWSTNCAFGDYDRDGDVDLYVANYLNFHANDIRPRGCTYRGIDVFCGPLGLPGQRDRLFRNNGDGTFTDVSREAGIETPGHYGFGVLFSDFNDDGWPDVYVANDAVPNFMYQNNQDGTFSEVGLISGTAVDRVGRAQAGMGVDAGDYDNDGDFDIFVTNFIDDTNTLYENVGDMIFADATVAVGLDEVSISYLGWGTGFVDLDNDGFKDLFVANGHIDPAFEGRLMGHRYLQRKEIYRNVGGRFEEIARSVGGDVLTGRATRGVAFGDYDNDGDVDAVSINLRDRPDLYRNEGGNRNHWISLRLEGTRSNRDAIGARVEIDAGGQTQVGEVRSGGSYLSHNDMRIHFGLGNADQVDAIRIRWPSGLREAFDSIPADRFVTLVEGEGLNLTLP